MNQNRSRSTIIYVLLFAAIIILVFYSFNQSSSSQATLSINQVAADIQAGKVTRIIDEQDKLTVIYGTGTQANDATEAKAIHTIFGTDVPVSSTKANVGHTLGASGAIEAVICV